MFIWFLKERDLVSESLFDPDEIRKLLKDDSPNSTSYYKAILQNLFFATLNTEPGQRVWASQQTPNTSNEYLNPNAFRYDDLFLDSSKAMSIFEEVPFLNGGLFECLDRLITPEELKEAPQLSSVVSFEKARIQSYTVQRIDGFSRRAENPIHIPNRLFFQDDAVSVDRLNEVYDTSGRDYKVRGLFPILNSYKFTVDENTPVEEEVALDPELLGKVFENLLASYNPETQTTARKQTGSFYTPREIVDYMVDESLHCYFKDKIAELSLPSIDDEIRSLLSYEDQIPSLNEASVGALIAAIDSVKVLDPACGSGAFPIGVLQKLVHFIGRIDPNNERWFKAQLNRVDGLREATLKIEALDVREEILSSINRQEKQVREAFERDELNYMRKLFLIRNSIYGVDIQPIAVQISKLRVFISLLVSESIDKGNKENNYGVQPLPNLESKFVAANTLVKIEQARQATFEMEDETVEAIKRELKEVRESKFFPKNFAAKKKLLERDRLLRMKLREELKQAGFGQTSSALIAEWDPDQQNSSAGFFDPEWMFLEKRGFDLVIGNPPYMRLQGLSSHDITYYREHFVSAKGSFDIYAIFVERCMKLLAMNGQLVFILPHKLFQATFAISLRQLLTDRKSLREVVRFGAEQVFDEATTYTCLLFLHNRAQDDFGLYEVKSLQNGRAVLDAIQKKEDHPEYQGARLSQPLTSDWDFGIGQNTVVKSRIELHKTKLADITRKIFVGLQTSSDKLYVLELVADLGATVRVRSKHTEQLFELEKALIKPFLMGKDVHRYEPPRPRNVVIFPYVISGGKALKLTARELERDFPLAWRNYLSPNVKAFESRENGKLSGENAFQYIYPKNLVEFDHIKIMTPEIAARPEFTLDSLGTLYHTTKVYSLALLPAWEPKKFFLLGLLNSKVMWFYLKQTGYVLRGGFYAFKTEYLKPFPIPTSSAIQERQISILVQTILALRASADPSFPTSVVSFFERIVDALVYELYFHEDFSDPLRRMSYLLESEFLLDPHLSILGIEGQDEINVIEVLERALATMHPDVPQTSSVIYTIIQMPGHDIRRAIHFMDSIESVRVVDDASKPSTSSK